MKIQWQILLFIMIFNVVIGVAIGLGVAGTEYVNPVPLTDADDYEAHFNQTEVIEGWKPSPFQDVYFVGDVFGSLNFYGQQFGYMIDGLPTLLTWIGDSFIVDSSGRTAFAFIADMLRAVTAILAVTFAVEFISGRVFTD